MSVDTITGFDYAQGAAVSKPRRDWQLLERHGFTRQVDGAKGETWYRAKAGRLAFEAYANIPAATNKVFP